MSDAAPFGVYTAEFPFVESDIGKIRPVIVASKPQGKHKLVVVIPVSSRTQLETVDRKVQNWQEAGLAKPSVARVHRITTLMQSDLRTELGLLTSSDTQQLKDGLQSLLQIS